MVNVMTADITGGVDLFLESCPCCEAAKQAWYVLDGDRLDVSKTIPDHLCAAFSLYPTLGVHRCDVCARESHTVQLDMIRNPSVDEAWEDKYFRLNEELEEPEEAFSVALEGGSPYLPRQWLLWRTTTPEGLLERHRFGPFITDDGFEEWLGLARCAGGGPWNESSKLLGRVWPVLVALYGRPEDFHVFDPGPIPDF